MAIPAQKTPTSATGIGARPGTPGGARPGAPAQGAPGKISLKKGQMLFQEGENSKAMYLLKTGMIRIFKKKGDSSIEIDTIRSGQIIGEMAFLDGNPRSASGEALTDCELVEISGPTFLSVLASAPDWLKLLLKTVVDRLRKATTRIRQLESSSTAFDYSDKDGKRESHYVYFGPHDVLKLSTTILLAASRSDQMDPTTNAPVIKLAAMSTYANNVMGVPVAKLTTFMDVMAQVGICAATGADGETYIVKDPDFLDLAINYFVTENLAEPTKRHDISLRGFYIMSLMAKHMAKYPADKDSGMSRVNIGEIKTQEGAATGKEPFRMDEFPELAKLGYCTQADLKSTTEIYTQLKPDQFILHYKFQRVAMAIHAVNEQKRKGAR